MAALWPAIAQKMFLKIGDIKGESKNTRFKEWIDIKAYSLAAGTSASYQGGVISPGKVQLSDLTFTLCIDASMNELRTAMFKGAVIGQGEFVVTTEGKDGALPLFKMEMRDIIITSMQEGGIADANELPSVNMSIQFGKYRTLYYEVDSKTGLPTTKVFNQSGWDRVNQVIY